MISIMERFKIFLIGIIAFLLFVFGYKKGTEFEQNKHLKGDLDAIKKAKKARDGLVNDDTTAKLHNKYSRKR